MKVCSVKMASICYLSGKCCSRLPGRANFYGASTGMHCAPVQNVFDREWLKVGGKSIRSENSYGNWKEQKQTLDVACFQVVTKEWKLTITCKDVWGVSWSVCSCIAHIHVCDRCSQWSQRRHDPQFSRKSCRFVFREAVSQTKYCCSLKVKKSQKYLVPPKHSGWLRYCTRVYGFYGITNRNIPVHTVEKCRVLSELETKLANQITRGVP